ncbi:TIGR02300 family protein [Hyphomicrobium sp. CS1GBMeth3]|uniref:TIGR02300 family protein n=1 Tax=Hyphomicrobium sp. CS1GBMeth3 TaxID=1892845 RepID=UPI00092FFA40|nr:TIGR02300 family protein [Hyphomicrobium sp. CS1GBMeth3]
MATKQARGTKRTCQSGECGARFYDLNRNPIICPICGSIYELASSPLALAAAVGEEKPSRRGRKADYGEKAPVDATAEGADDEALPDVEEDGEAIGSDEDETFLEEEEEEGGDVSNIIGGPVSEGDEER